MNKRNSTFVQCISHFKVPLFMQSALSVRCEAEGPLLVETHPNIINWLVLVATGGVMDVFRGIPFYNDIKIM